MIWGKIEHSRQEKHQVFTNKETDIYMERTNCCSYFRVAGAWALSSAVGKDEAGEVSRDRLAPGELCVASFPYMAWGLMKNLSMEVSSSGFRKIISICIRGLEIYILLDPAILS